MKIALINGSPKFKHSASGIILNSIKAKLQDNNIIEEYNFIPNKDNVKCEEKSNIPDDIFNFLNRYK